MVTFSYGKKQTIANKFWNDVVQSVYSVYTNATVRSLEHLLAMPLWYNTKIISEKIKLGGQRYFDYWRYMDAEGHIFTIEYIKTIYN